MTHANHLFLSYNSHDRETIRVVQSYLSEHGIPTFFDQQNLRAGLNWPQALEQALKDSYAVAVFVGAEIGRWQWPEIGFALDRQANDPQFPVIPILLDGADTSRSFLFLNSWVDLRGGRIRDTESLQRLLNALANLDEKPNEPIVDLKPYRGLEFFDEAHAPFFFGREIFIDDLVSRLTEQRKNFVAVIGASGSGKSSVVRAGLIPHLRRQRPPHETWDVAVFTPGARPWLRLADALGPLRFPDKSDTELDTEVDKLARGLYSGELDLGSLLDRILRRQGQTHRLLLVVDQFEELFTLTPNRDRSIFIQQLMKSLSTEGLVLVPTLRADFYGHVIEADRQLSNLLGREQVTLGRLTSEELLRVVVEPARLSGLEFDPGLPELLLRDAGNEPGNLPLLQHALLQLHAKKQGRQLTSAAYQAIGGIHQAIANTAEDGFKEFEKKHQGTLVRRVFTQLVRLARADEGLEDTRRRVAIATLPPEAKPIVDEFANYRFRLLIKASERMAAGTGKDGNESSSVIYQETVEVAHEALIHEWSRLKDWLNEDRGFYLWRQRLDQALREYEEHDRDPSYLLQGPLLKETEGKLEGAIPEPLSTPQRDFIKMSMDERGRLAREAKAAEEKRQREKDALVQREKNALQKAAEQERKARTAAEQAQAAAESARQIELQRRQEAERSKRNSRIGMLILLVIMIFAVSQYWQANRQRKAVISQALAMRAKALEARHERTQATLVSALALLIHHTQAAKDSAVALLSSGDFRGHPLRSHQDRSQQNQAESFALKPDGTLIVGGIDDITVHLTDAATGQSKGNLLLRGGENAISSVAFNHDGTRIVSSNWDRTLQLWDAKTGQPIGEPISGHGAQVKSVAFSPDGSRIVSGSSDRTVRLWDADTGRPLGEPLLGHENKVTSVAFSPNGSHLASASLDNTLRLWDADTGQPLSDPLRGHTDTVRSVAFSPDGTLIVSGSQDATLRLWDAETGQPIGEPLRGHADIVESVAFSPDSTRLISGSLDKTLRLWDAKSGQQIGEPLQGHEDFVESVAFSPDGTRIVSGSHDGTLRLWNAKTAQKIGEPLRGHEKGVLSVAFSPDGTCIVSGGEDNTVRLWYARFDHPIGEPLRGHEDIVEDVAFSPDSTRIISGSLDKTLRLWDAKSGQPIGEPLRGHAGGVSSVAFSPDGSRLVSGDFSGILRRWDAKTGQPIGDALRGDDTRITVVAFNPDGTRFISGGWDSSLHLWDATTGEPIGEPLLGHGFEISSVAFSPDGSRLVSGSRDGTLRLWDAKSGQLIGEPLTDHTEWVLSVAFSPDGSRFISGSADQTMRLWDAGTGQPIGEPLRGNEAAVGNLAFSPDGSRIVSTRANALQLWDTKTGQPIGEPLPGHTDTVYSVAFSPDGTRIVSGSKDKTLRLWDTELLKSGEDLYLALCDTVHRNLTKAEWKQYMPESEEFRAVCANTPIEK